MKIGIIDAEIMGKSSHRFPNLVCMKLSGYYKKLGNEVKLLLSYDNLEDYDKIFISKVFIKTELPNENKDKTLKTEDSIIEFYKNHPILNMENVSYGGTGFYYDKSPKLEEYIEHHMPDYSLYNEWVDLCIKNGAKEKEFTYYKDYSIGFVTRGCFRQCQFCVNRNYKQCNKHSLLCEFMDESRPKLCFLDDNFFACKDWKNIIKEIKETGKRFQFKQGLDERLLTKEKCEEINSWKYDGDIIFAFDNIEDRDLIIKKLDLFRTYYKKKAQNVKFYVFCGFDRSGIYDVDFWKQDIIDTFERIFILSKYNCKSYIMRHENYNNSPYRGTYINLAFWANQPSLFFNHSYYQICEKDDDRKGGLKKSATWRYLEQFRIENKEISEKYFHVVPKDLFINY